jgi:hypothetical protein
MIAILKRELKSYFINMSGYLFAAILLLFTGIFTTAANLIGQYTGFEYALQPVDHLFPIGCQGVSGIFDIALVGCRSCQFRNGFCF